MNRNHKKAFLVLKSYWMVALLFAMFSGCTGEAPEERAPLPSESAPAQAEPWTQEQLMDVAELAKVIDDSSLDTPVILDIGGVGPLMGGQIKTSRLIGPTSDPENLEKLITIVSEYPEDIDLVIYCGCCPFEDCPNIRPAFRVLQEMQQTNLKLLDVPQNLRVDWANQGYPVEK